MNITLSNIVNIETATDSAQETIIVLTGADGAECVVTAFKTPQVTQEEVEESFQEDKEDHDFTAICDMVKRFNVPPQYRSKIEYRLLMNVNKGIPVSFTAEELGQALLWEDSLEGHPFWSLMSDIIDTHNAK